MAVDAKQDVQEGGDMNYQESKTERPEFVTESHLLMLDELRESGVTNMLGARPYVKAYYPELSTEQAGEVLAYWMKTFGDRHNG